MKRAGLLILFIMLLGKTITMGQMISYRKQIIYLDEKPYAYLLKTGSAWAKNFSFQNTNNEELAAAKAITKDLADGYDYVYYEVTFKGYQQKAEMEDNAEFANRLARELAGLNILKNDQLDETAVQKFLEKYPPNISKRLNAIPHHAAAPVKEKTTDNEAASANRTDQKAAQISTTEPINMSNPVLNQEPTAVAITGSPAAKPESKPELNTFAPVAASSSSAMNVPAAKNATVSNIKVSGTTILKGNQKLGRFAVNEKAINDKLNKTYSFYNAKNLKVADASFTSPTSTDCKITTTQDKKVRLVKITNDGEALKALALWLVQNRYL